MPVLLAGREESLLLEGILLPVMLPGGEEPSYYCPGMDKRAKTTPDLSHFLLSFSIRILFLCF